MRVHLIGSLSLAALLLSSCYAGPEYGQAYMTGGQQALIHYAPPPPVAEMRPPVPMPDAVWVPGFWGWNGGGWRWMPGRYEVRRGYVWVPPRYVQRPGGWVYMRGHWRIR